MFCDTHCHLYKQYYENIEEIILQAKENGVGTFVVDGCDRDSNYEVIELAKKYDFVYSAIGIHPENVDNYKKEDILFIEKSLNDERVVAIGEIGLDYHYTKDNKDKQKSLFITQLELARKYHKPVVVHSREATLDTIQILKMFPDVKGIIHGFSGSIETARIFIKMGYKLGINGVVTFKNSHLKELLPEILNSIVLETDSPYLTPHPFRGTKNSPKYISLIADFVCEYSGISRQELLDITNRNIQGILGF